MKIADFIKALLGVLLLRLLKPWAEVRVAKLSSDRLGYQAFEPELYLCRAKERGRRSIDLFYLAQPVANKSLAAIWRRNLTIWPGIEWVDRLNRRIPGWQAHTIDLGINNDEDTTSLLAQYGSHLALTAGECAVGEDFLRGMGLAEGDQFVCFTNRKAAHAVSGSGDGYRDCSIDKMERAVTRLLERGHFVFRLGEYDDAPLSLEHERLIDYARDHREDFLDIFLLSRCRYLLAPNSGPYVTATVCRRPVALVNLSPFLGTNGFFNEGDLFIPKKYWIVAEKRLMRFSEIFKSGAGDFMVDGEFASMGIETVENSAEEIEALAVQMEMTLSGAWRGNEDAIELQDRLAALLRREYPRRRMPRMGDDFLLQNRDLVA